MAEIVAEYIDRLCTIEMRSQGNLPRGVTHRLYEVARAAQQAGPLTLLAATALRSRLVPGCRVFLVTGAGGPPHVPHGETDGPPGVVALARSLALGLAVIPVFVLEERHVPPVVAAAAAAGLPILGSSRPETAQSAATVAHFPCGVEEGRATARALFHELRPEAVVFVEKLGPNHKGVVHSVTGYHRDPATIGSAFWMAEEARARGVLTIGVGDNGNEIGFGKIQGAVQEILPDGRKCRCSCDGGIACAVETDILVVSAISNWGAYGISACLALLAGDPSLLHDEHVERMMLEACAREGAVDGALGSATPGVDGAPMDVHIAFVTMLRWIVSSGLRTISRPF